MKSKKNAGIQFLGVQMLNFCGYSILKTLVMNIFRIFLHSFVFYRNNWLETEILVFKCSFCDDVNN